MFDRAGKNVDERLPRLNLRAVTVMFEQAAPRRHPRAGVPPRRMPSRWRWTTSVTVGAREAPERSLIAPEYAFARKS
jgi:hypothetical protein